MGIDRAKGKAGRRVKQEDRGSGHCDIDVLHRHLAMDLLHRCAGVLHCDEGFLVDVCGLDGVDLLLEHRDLAVCLLKGVLVLLFSLQCVFGHYARSGASARKISRITFLTRQFLLKPSDHRVYPPASCTRLGAGVEQHTGLVGRDIISGYLILLRHLVLEMLFAFLQHVELLP